VAPSRVSRYLTPVPSAVVGKTALLVRFTEEKFELKMMPTVGISFGKKTVELDR
jgi:GTPase SAR1 family protein